MPLFTPVDQDDCVTCHQPDFEGAHGGSGFPTTCTTCHDANAWDDATFEHAMVANGFGLVGAHDQLPCAACHNPPPGFEPLFLAAGQDDCVACHQADYQQEHADSGFPTTCLTCHDTEDWSGAIFEHAALANGFGLVGAHEALDCSACHGPPPDLIPLFTPTNQDDCFTCHQQDYQDEHADDGFPTTCLTCHNTDDWDDATFAHAAIANGFGLVGAHEVLDCSACHGPPPDLVPLFTPTDQDDCFTCHQDDYQDEHAGTGFPTTCLSCHNTQDWDDATFSHASVSNGFALVGAHEVLDCSACHGPPPGFEPLFSATGDEDCVACHQPDFDNAHAGSGYPTSCLSCHNTDEWEGAVFEHAAVANGFGLVGSHEQLPCLACHNPPPGFEPIFAPTNEDDCFTCHQQDYQDEHAGSGFPTTCLTCHDVDGWDFSHTSAGNGFSLIGAHDALDCSACHAPDLTPLFNPQDENDCFTCHQVDYQQEHANDGFPYECLTCHTVNTWSGATFNHASASGGYPLVGAHEAQPCSACHGPPPDLVPLFNPANADDCYTCHQDEYQQEHGGSGFPTTCLVCHNNDDWGDADFNHDAAFFPIFSGKHRNEWQTCMDCHIDPDNFNIFSCLTCHEHNQQDTDDDHSEVQGYVYESSACYACHPNGDN